MDDLKIIIGKNLSSLRKARKLTQLELAEKLNYSDKAVSKWEQGATTPDIETLKQLCDFYGVTLDYLVDPSNIYNPQYDVSKEKIVFVNHIIITCLLGSIVWMIATIIFVYPLLFLHKETSYWIAFVWAVPASGLVAMFCNFLYFRRNKVTTLVMMSINIWSTLTAIFLHCLFFVESGQNLWLLFILGIPMETCLALWFVIRRK